MEQVNARMTARWAAIALLTIVIAGCQLQTDISPSVDVGADKPSGQAVSNANNNADSPPQAFDKGNQSGNAVVNPFPENEDSTVADARMESSGGSAVSALANKDGNWDPKAPKLRGIAVGQKLSALESSLGKPKDSYSLQDEDEALTVREYAGYSVGFGKDNKVKFVEVFDKESSTGLNGLRVGSDGDAAVKLIGKPDTHTASVIAYKLTDAMLKLDIDPDSGKILSVKLFADD